MKKTVCAAIKEQRRSVPPVVTADLAGKTVVVVGANTGLGLEASKHFARMNPGRLVLACRNQDKGNAAVLQVKEETGIKEVELGLLDLSSFSSVVGFVDGFLKDPNARLDILVANAAIYSTEYKVTPDGWEESVQVNDLSTSLLCLLLSPRMVATAERYPGTKPRIVIVSSDLHYFSKIDQKVFESPSSFEALNSKEYCTPSKMETRYLETKLLNVFFTRSFAELLRNTPVIATTVNPGYCYSGLRRSLSTFRAAVDSIIERTFARTTEEGGRQLVYAAVGHTKDPDALRGQYVDLHQVAEATEFIVGDGGRARQDKLWVDLVAELSAIDSRVGDVVRTHST